MARMMIMMFMAFCVIAGVLSTLPEMSDAMIIDTAKYQTSTVSDLTKFDSVTNESTEKDSNGCKQVYQLPVTIQAGDGYKVEMTPPNVVTPVVQDSQLYFNINSDFETYKGEAGVLVTIPENELDKVIAATSSTFNVLPSVIETSGDFYLEASTSATVYIQEIEDDDMTIDASTSAMVYVTTSSDNTDLDVDISEASTSATIHINGAHEVEIDDASTSASIELVGGNLESVTCDDLSTSATIFAMYTDDDSDTELTLKDISTSGQATMMNCDDLEVKDSFSATVFTDDSKNCDQVKSQTQGSFAGLTCTVKSDLEAPSTPSFPADVVIEVDLTSNKDCAVFSGINVGPNASITIGGSSPVGDSD